MDLFKDKVYEELDDISQMIEPFEFAVNNELSLMPDKIKINASFFESIVFSNSGREKCYIDTRKVIEYNTKWLNLHILSKHANADYDFSNNFFTIEMSENTHYNAETKELIGEIYLIKKKVAYEDKEIEKMLINYMRSTFNCHLGGPSSINKSNINEICDLFNLKEALQDRKSYGKVKKLFNKYEQLINDRELNIRDVELFKRFIDWNVKYIKHGNLPAMSNITKVKIMMRNGLPIYSIKEDEV